MSTTKTRNVRKSKPTHRKGRRWQVHKSSNHENSNDMSVRILKLRKSVNIAADDVEGKYMVSNWTNVEKLNQKKSSPLTTLISLIAATTNIAL